jgi:RNA polymerase sigma-70 factor (ECF subfamily)
MVKDLADVDLMMKVKKGDRAAFSVLVGRYRKPLVNFIYRFTMNPGEAEDLAQEVFLRVYQSASRYEPKASFSTWIYRIATNVTLNHLRDHKPHLQSSLDAVADNGTEASSQWPDPHPLIEEQLIRRERVDQIQKAIAVLPEKQRLAVILTKYQDLSLREAANILNCSEMAVKSLLFRAYTTLREQLVAVMALT